MVDEELAKRQFSSLKPHCVSLMKDKSLPALQNVQEIIQNISPIIPSLLEYVLLPLQVTLRHSINLDTHLTEKTLSCMTTLFNSSTISSELVFFELFTIFCSMLEKKDKSLPSEARLSLFKGTAHSSEEMTEGVLKTLQHLLVKSELSLILDKFYTRIVSVGCCLSVLLGLLKERRSRGCVINTLHCLVAVSYCNSNGWMNSLVSNNFNELNLGKGQGHNVFPSFLPGLCMSLHDIAVTSGVHNLGQSVVSLSVLVLAHYIVLVLNDQQWENRNNSTHTTTSNSENDADDQLSVVQDTQWWSTTDNKLQKLISSLLSLVQHDNWKVRMSLVAFVSAFLKSCSNSLPSASGSVLELLVSLSLDEQSTVSSAALNIMDTLSSSRSLTSSLEEKLYELASSLPRLLKESSSESNKLIILKLLQGYLSLLKSHVSHMTCSPAHMTRLLQALAQAVKLDTSNVPLLLEENKVGVVNLNEGEEWVLPLSFTHLRDESVIQAISEICRLIGCYGNTAVVMDTLIQAVMGNSLNSCEYLLLFHWILKGVESPHPSLIRVIDWVVEEDREERENNFNIIYKTCLMLHLIEDVSFVQRQEFFIHLQTILGVVMSHISNSNMIVSRTAVGVANLIAKHTGYMSINNLIIDCADYLVNEVLHSFLYGQPSNGCHILKAIIDNSNYCILPLLTDCIKTLLLTIDQCLYEGWTVWLSLANKLPEWVAIETPTIIKKEDKREEKREGEDEFDRDGVSIEDIAQYFNDYHKRKKEEEEREEMEVDDSTNTAEDSYFNPEGPQSIPPAVQASIDVLGLSVHYMSHTNPSLQLCVLNCISLCLTALKDREKDLLPQVHIVWLAFIHRLTDKNIPVRIKAVDLLLTMCSVAKEFLRKRVIEQVWPKLTYSLDEMRHVLHEMTPTTHHTMEYKLLMKIISTVGELCRQLKVSVVQSEVIISSVLLYLSKDAPQSVQEISLSTCRVLYAHDPDLVWLLCAQLCPSLLPSFPSNSPLINVKLPQSTSAHLYENNIMKLLT